MGTSPSMISKIGPKESNIKPVESIQQETDSKKKKVSEDSKRKVCVIYTGGTIGMKEDEKGRLVCSAGYLESEIKKAMNSMSQRSGVGKLPEIELLAYDPLLDSAEMTPSDWNKIGTTIATKHDVFDGFVVIHGTDTMTYTASALSFMLTNLQKTVVLTGSQLPWCDIRTDARQNLMLALVIAANYEIPEVCIAFHNRLLRGNRSVKADSHSLSNAFRCPNENPLGVYDLKPRLDWNLITSMKPRNIKGSGSSSTCTCMCVSEQAVVVMRILPGLSSGVLMNMMSGSTKMKAIIFECYGSGTVPSYQAFKTAVKQLSEKGVIVVVVTQCYSGAANAGVYASGDWLNNAGVVSAKDMTCSCAYTKLVYLLSLKNVTRDEIKRLFVRSLRGEVRDDLFKTERRSSRTKSGQLSPSVSVRGLRRTYVRLGD
jgi:L-asparaginase